MPPARTLRGRAINNENDENNTQRVTRAKAAGLSVPNDSSLPVKKPLQAKKAATNVKANAETQVKKRAALGDVSNVHKTDSQDQQTASKKVNVTSQGSLASKTASGAGISKAARPTSTNRSVLGQKDRNATGNELKRPASTADIAAPAAKKRSSGSSASSRRSVAVDASPRDDENVAPPSNANAMVNVKETIKVRTETSDGVRREKEIVREEQKPRFEVEAEVQNELAEQIALMDDEDTGDPLMVAEYVYEILDYMRELEIKTMPNANYMSHQKDLEWRMRGVLVDWLLEVHTRFHLLPETFYLTVNIIDRFLTHKVVQLDRLQLVGVTAMFIASKYEEVLSPHVGNFVRVADDGFSEAEILNAERYVLSTLDYDLSFANPMHFMRRISKADNYDIQTRTLAKYLLEISLLDHRFLQFPPSINAAASMHLSRTILERSAGWDDILVHYSGYTEEEIRPAFETMIDYLRSPVEHSGFYKKYAGKKFLKASLHARAWAKAHATEHLTGCHVPA